METKRVLFFCLGYWNGHAEGFFLLSSIHLCEITTSLLLQHQPRALRWLKVIIVWLIMSTGEFLLHKKLSWYESDKSSVVSSHVNSIQSLLCAGNRAEENVACWVLHTQKSSSIFAASPNYKTFPCQNCLSFSTATITAGLEHQSVQSCSWQSPELGLSWVPSWEQRQPASPSYPGSSQERGSVCSSTQKSEWTQKLFIGCHQKLGTNFPVRAIPIVRRAIQIVPTSALSSLVNFGKLG